MKRVHDPLKGTLLRSQQYFNKNIVNDITGGGGGHSRVVRWCWVNLQCRGVLLIWIIAGQGPTALKVGVGRVVWTCFFLSSIISLFFLPLVLGDGPI